MAAKGSAHKTKIEASAGATSGALGIAQGGSTVLSRLGLFGLESLAPVIMAALATEEPMLLIGPHGTGKSLLLTRIAATLGLEFRHYNASLVNFDDLVGFPVPGADGSLTYAQTPATIWGAGAVIFDEISRCRPDIQNKLFPIVHERRAQGLLLDDLRYRWAAMNPPLSPEEETGYLGSEPLDEALADRFAFVVPMPGWQSLSPAEQTAVLLAGQEDCDASAAVVLADTVARTRASLRVLDDTMGKPVAVYVRTLMALLDQAGLAVSPRRGGMLRRVVIAVHAAALILDPTAKPADSALLALVNALPHRAQGRTIPLTKVVVAHKEAWRQAAIKPRDPLHAILTASDPVDRVRLAVEALKLPKGEFSGIIADAVAQLSPGARDAVIAYLFETGAVGRLNAAVAEQVAERYQALATPVEFAHSVHGTRARTWREVKAILSRLDPAEGGAHLTANMLAASYARNEIQSGADAEQVVDGWTQTEARLAGAA